LRLVFSNKTIL